VQYNNVLYSPWKYFLFSWEGRIEGQVFWCRALWTRSPDTILCKKIHGFTEHIMVLQLTYVISTHGSWQDQLCQTTMRDCTSQPCIVKYTIKRFITNGLLRLWVAYLRPLDLDIQSSITMIPVLFYWMGRSSCGDGYIWRFAIIVQFRIVTSMPGPENVF